MICTKICCPLSPDYKMDTFCAHNYFEYIFMYQSSDLNRINFFRFINNECYHWFRDYNHKNNSFDILNLTKGNKSTFNYHAKILFVLDPICPPDKSLTIAVYGYPLRLEKQYKWRPWQWNSTRDNHILPMNGSENMDIIGVFVLKTDDIYMIAEKDTESEDIRNQFVYRTKPTNLYSYEPTLKTLLIYNKFNIYYDLNLESIGD